MRKSAILVCAALAALLVGAVGFATADESVQTEQAKVTPSKLPKKGNKNIKLTNTIVTKDAPGTFQPPSANRTVLDLPKQVKINTKSVPYCKTTPDGLASAATVADAKKACGKKSQVSDDKKSSAQVRVGSAVGATTIPVDVVAFNENGKKLILYSKPTGAFSSIAASILVGKLKESKSGKAYDKALDVTIPKLAAGAISFFEVTIPKSKYIMAKCNNTTVKAQATTYFDDGAKTTDDHSVKCKGKK